MGPQGPCWRGAYCFLLARKPITTMDNQKTSTEAKLPSKFKKVVKTSAIGIGIFLAIIIIAVIVDSSNDPKPTTDQAASVVQTEEQKQAAAEPFNIEVTSQIVKKVDGKYRYFFDIRNKDTKDFEGAVTIKLINGEGKGISEETFNTNKPISPTLGTSQYIQASTGTAKIHGSNGYAKFTYTAKQNNQVVKTGEGTISEAYEDLSQ